MDHPNTCAKDMALAELQHKNPTLFPDLPWDVKEVIYRFAVTHSESIKPHYRKESGKFDLNGATQTYGSNNSLVVTSLMATCKVIRADLISSKIFYKCNDFEFWLMKDLLAYLLALDPKYRDAISTILIQFSSWEKPEATFLLLSACQGLRHLIIDITLLPKYFDPGNLSFADAPGYHQLTTIRGLESLKLTYGTKSFELCNFPKRVIEVVRQQSMGITAGLALHQEVSLLQKTLFQVMRQPRRVAPISPLLLYSAIQNFLGNCLWSKVLRDIVNGAYLPGGVNLNLFNSGGGAAKLVEDADSWVVDTPTAVANSTTNPFGIVINNTLEAAAIIRVLRELEEEWEPEEMRVIASWDQ
jgi:hypothetical protein